VTAVCLCSLCGILFAALGLTETDEEPELHADLPRQPSPATTARLFASAVQ